MPDLKIMSYNCRGLNVSKKRTDVLMCLKDQKPDSLCLQDTNFVKTLEKHMYSFWNGECHYSQINPTVEVYLF